MFDFTFAIGYQNSINSQQKLGAARWFKDAFTFCLSLPLEFDYEKLMKFFSQSFENQFDSLSDPLEIK